MSVGFTRQHGTIFRSQDKRTRQANNQAILTGPNALPDGPYLLARKP